VVDKMPGNFNYLGLAALRQLVWQIERELIEEDARPDILYVRGITCRRPYVKGLISMVNSIYNGSRFEGVWLANWVRRLEARMC
jgi:hypothetical protein